ncbi:MAG: hypothetical protein WB973_05545 [Thermoanaerobaculia bacterium]
MQRRLYAHHDYFGNVIPSTWFVIASLLGTFVFYRKSLAAAVDALHRFVQPLGEPTTGVDVLIAVVLAIASFNIIYVVGQLLNGVAAVVLDRLIVKKLLNYPFTLYEMKWRQRAENKTDAMLLREAMLGATYFVFCVNLIPVFFFEAALVAFGRMNPYAGSWVQKHPVFTLILSFLLVVAHFGIPSVRKAREICGRGEDAKNHRFELVIWHAVIISFFAIIIGATIALVGVTEIVLLLPFANLVLGYIDRKMLLTHGPNYKTAATHHVFVYIRRTFLNASYLAAKIVGYSASPDAELIGHALAKARYGSKANDFYWMCQLRLENEAPRSYDTAYHGMAMYTMNRNLCNATAFIAVISVVAFYVQWPDGYRYSPLVWITALCVLTYMFFIRYLYLFSGSYCKYVVRAAAFMANREPSTIVERPKEDLLTLRSTGNVKSSDKHSSLP